MRPGYNETGWTVITKDRLGFENLVPKEQLLIRNFYTNVDNFRLYKVFFSLVLEIELRTYELSSISTSLPFLKNLF